MRPPAVVRAELRLQDAALMAELAAAGRTAIRAELQLARVHQHAAASSNDPAEAARAGELWVRAVLHDRSTQAHAAYARGCWRSRWRASRRRPRTIRPPSTRASPRPASGTVGPATPRAAPVARRTASRTRAGPSTSSTVES